MQLVEGNGVHNKCGEKKPVKTFRRVLGKKYGGISCGYKMLKVLVILKEGSIFLRSFLSKSSLQ